MAQAWENDAIKAAGKRYQEAQKRGDQNGMAAAAAEANRLRQESGYSLNGGQSNSRPTLTDSSKWMDSGTNKVYQSKGLGWGTPNVDYAVNAARQSAGGSSARGGRADSYANGWDNQISSSQKAYEKMLRQIEEQNRLAVEQSVGRLEANRSAINQNYDEAARQAYIRKMQTEKNLPQMLAGQGLTGGASETARLAIDTSYGNDVNASELARQNALSTLEQAISDVRSTGDWNLADQRLALQQQAMADQNNLYAQKVAQDNFLKQWQQQAERQEMEDYSHTAGAYADDYTAEINRLLAAGYDENSYQIKMLKQARAEKLLQMYGL